MGDNAYKKLHRETGLCYDCSEPVIPGLRRCHKHNENRKKYWFKHKKKESAWFKKLKEQRVKDGKCRDCGRPKIPEIDGEFALCINCRMHLRPHRWRHLYGTDIGKSTG